MFKRTKGKYNSLIGIDQYYAFYSATVSDPLPKQLFRSIFRGYIEQIMVNVIYNSGEFSMGQKLGSVRVREKDYKLVLDSDGNIDKTRLVPDWGKTLKKWKKIYADIPSSEWKNIEDKPIIYLLNEHSDSTLKQWFWDKTTCNIYKQSLYKFDATRYWDRLLCKVNKESNVSYYR